MMELAPDFELPDDNGNLVRLKDFRGKNWVVLFFYPKDDTPFCSLEACAFRERYESFVLAGAVLFGISPDSMEDHRTFKQRFHLPFQLLTDEGGRVCEAYGVPRMLGLLPGRGTYIINPNGALQYSFLGQFDPCKHADTAFNIVLQNTAAGDSINDSPNKNTLLPAMKHVVGSYVKSHKSKHNESVLANLANYLKQTR